MIIYVNNLLGFDRQKIMLVEQNVRILYKYDGNAVAQWQQVVPSNLKIQNYMVHEYLYSDYRVANNMRLNAKTICIHDYLYWVGMITKQFEKRTC